MLLFGVSHRSAPVSVLERLSTDESDQAKILDRVLQSSLVTEAMVLSTCNRVELVTVEDQACSEQASVLLVEAAGLGLENRLGISTKPAPRYHRRHQPRRGIGIMKVDGKPMRTIWRAIR